MSVEITRCTKCKSTNIERIKIIKIKASAVSDTVQFKCNDCNEVFNSEEYNPEYNQGQYLV